MGDLLLFPTHPVFKGRNHLECPTCRKEIVPMTPIDLELLDDGRVMLRHAECADKNIKSTED